MLSKKDREWVEAKFKEYLFRTITVEKAARGPGEVDKRIEKQNRYILDVLVEYLPYMEGAWRGVQEDVDKMKSRQMKLEEQVEKVGQLLTALENAITTMARFAVVMQRSGLLESMEHMVAIDGTAEVKKIESGSR